jgi:hypothetical protein
MSLDPETAKALARASRRDNLKREVERHRGAVDGTANLARVISEQNQAAHQRHQEALAELEAHDSGNDAVVEKFGYRSALDDVLREERQLGKVALVTFVKANPNCHEVDAVRAWVKGVKAPVCQDVAALLTYYRGQLVSRGAIASPTWPEHRNWIVMAPFEDAVGG